MNSKTNSSIAIHADGTWVPVADGGKSCYAFVTTLSSGLLVYQWGVGVFETRYLDTLIYPKIFAIHKALEWAKGEGEKGITVLTDSEEAVEQIEGVDATLHGVPDDYIRTVLQPVRQLVAELGGNVAWQQYNFVAKNEFWRPAYHEAIDAFLDRKLDQTTVNHKTGYYDYREPTLEQFLADLQPTN